MALEQRRIETQAELKTANWREPVFSIFSLLGMDLRVGLDPLAGVVIGDLGVVAVGKGPSAGIVRVVTRKQGAHSIFGKQRYAK